MDWLNYKYLNNEVWHWIALFGILLGSLGIGKIIAIVLQGQARRLQQKKHFIPFATLLRAMSGPLVMVFLATGLYLAPGFMNLQWTYKDKNIDITPFWMDACSTIIALAVGWFIYRLVEILEHYLHRWAGRTETTLDDQLVPLIRKTLRIFIVIVVGLFIAQNIFHWNIGALVAGLGIGGLAFALAAKDMLANLFGSVTIFADRPFQMGDFIKFNGELGTVEQVGFRSTRLRLLNGHQLVVPNAKMADDVVENITRRPSIRRVMNVTVTYDTPPEKMEKGIAIIRDMLEARTDHFPLDFPPRVFFNDFNAASLNIAVYYWYAPADWWEYLAFSHDFNMELLRRFNDEGIEFAFPTQTLYVKQDSNFTVGLENVPKPEQP